MELEAFADELRDRYAEYGSVTNGDSLIRVDTADFTSVDYGEITEIVRKAIR